jgi:micrococcal nuclease
MPRLRRRPVLFVAALALVSFVAGWRAGRVPGAPLGDADDPWRTRPAFADRDRNAVALRRGAIAGPVRAFVLRVVDGDTFEARVRIWFGQEITTLVRIRGVDAPELRSRCDEEARGAAAASDALARFLDSGSVTLRDVVLDKYGGRVVASVFVSYGEAREDVGAALVAEGWARSYAGGKRLSWCDLPIKSAGVTPP